LVVMVGVMLAGCQVVPSAGPIASDINAAAGKSAAEQNRQTATVFDIVDINASTARIISEYQNGTLNRKFGFGGRDAVVLGVGDELRVSIFEAGVDGLFSTTESKQTTLLVVVQPDGNAAIPYVGPVRFAGRTMEQARQSILESLKGKAVEPDVILGTVSTASRTVTVSGAVRSSGLIPLGLKGDQLSEVIAKAGGPDRQPYETYITLTRGKKVGNILLKYVIENPKENIYVYPDDQIFLTHDPRTFTVLGETLSNNRISFGSDDLSLVEAIGLAQGGRDDTADPKGVFVFRYEDRDLTERLLGRKRFEELLAKGMMADKLGRYPIVYRIDLARADGLLVAQTFPIKNRDLVYTSRHPSIDLTKFLQIIQGPLSLAQTVSGI
jgi:polysaccharide export outer membrane protein